MFFLKNNYKLLIFIIILLIILAYVTNITSIPNSIILFQNQDFNIQPIFGITLEETIPVGAEIVNSKLSTLQNENLPKTFPNVQSTISEKEYNLSLLGFNLKKIKVNIIPNTKVIPLGNIAGLKLYTKGVLVVGVSQIEGEDNKVYKPYEEAGIKQGDTILEINDELIETTEELIACVSKCKGNDIKITYNHNGETLKTMLKPVRTSKNTYKIGLWVRDAAAGVGTLTFYDPQTNSFAALGHGIQDIDTEELVDISSGELVSAEIVDIEKGIENNPGKINGIIEENKIIGKIYSNTEYGIYGLANNKNELKIDNSKEIEVAPRSEITTGKASIICTLEDGIRKEYEVQIEKIYEQNNQNNKSMIVKVTDDELIGKTGGIIQGMSGSPIIQNGKLIGALTHVLVSDPKKRIWCICR